MNLRGLEMTNSTKANLKVGDVATATGVTIRTLHHYEEIGLLEPSSRSESGHRIYSERDLQRLQQILSLKQLGFSLGEIRNCLLEKSMSPLEIVRLHQKRVLEGRDQLSKLYDQLITLERTLAANEAPSTEELLTTIEVIQMYDKYFTKEQLEELKNRKDSIGEAKMKNYQNAWTELMAKVRTEMNKKTDPASSAVQALAKEWSSLVSAFSGGNTSIEVNLGSMYRNEPAMREKVGMDADYYEYVAKMMAYYHKAKA